MTEPGTPPLAGVTRLLQVVARLRSEGGCPWDREQTLATLKPFLVEEAYELLDAIDSGDPARHRDELGDVLLQVALQAEIRREEQRFTFDDVASHLADKLVRRHPHVFGDIVANSSDAVLRNWEAIKAGEKAAQGKEGAARSALEGVPRHLPALRKAQRVQSRAARVGFDWDKAEDVLAKVREELEETAEAVTSEQKDKVVEEIGDLLFSIVNLCRFHGVDAEDSLGGTIAKFTRRFQQVEARIHAEGRTLTDCTLAEMDAHWNAVKEEERRQPPQPQAEGA